MSSGDENTPVGPDGECWLTPTLRRRREMPDFTFFFFSDDPDLYKRVFLSVWMQMKMCARAHQPRPRR